jgi:phage terminase Nu1 subunit (DNA packaging protein)
MDLNQPVSGRELARLTGQSEGAVRKARDRQSIIKGLTSDGKYIPLIASEEWGKPILQEFLGAKKKPVKKEVSVKPIVLKKQKKEPETIDEIFDEIMSEKLPAAQADDLDDETVSAELDDVIPKTEAERITSVLKAKILQITYAEKKGQLVPIEKVNSVLFGYGQEIRNAVEGITNRCIDNILSTETRNEAKRILDDEIYNTLMLLSDITERGI